MALPEINQPAPVYLDLASESEDPDVTQIETVCMNCFEKGTTRLLLTLIPHFREVMVSSFTCPHCQNTNSSLISTGTIQDKGIIYTLKVNGEADLRRMIVKSDHAILKIPEVELEVPAKGEKGEITSVEGVVRHVCDGLQQDQHTRRADNGDLANQIEDFIGRLEALLQGEPFTIELDDPSGNSYIERLSMNGFTDVQLTCQAYVRTPSHDRALGLLPEDADGVQASGTQSRLNDVQEEEEIEKDLLQEQKIKENSGLSDKLSDVVSNDDSRTVSSGEPCLPESPDKEGDAVDIHGEVMRFSTLCDRCHRPADTNMKVTQIPHFKEVVIMATVCDSCGNRTNEVKSGGGIAQLGRRIELRMCDPSVDMARDVLKSDSCSVEVPELELHVGGGVLGGRFTTLEGLLVSIKEDMMANPFFIGDSVENTRKTRVTKLLSDIDELVAGTREVTVILDDPAGNSYLQNVYAPDPDPNLVITEYERSYEQNEDLGLNDIKTEGYEDNE